MSDEKTPDQLFGELANRNLEGRIDAALALASINDKRAVEPLIDILKALLEPPSNGMTDTATRERIVFELGELRDPRAVNVLIDTLYAHAHFEEEDDDVYDEPDHKVIETASWALWQIGDVRAVEPIINRLLHDHWHGNWHYQWPEDWIEAAYKELLKALKSHDETTRKRGAALLGELGDKRAVEPFIEVSENDRAELVRHSAAYALSVLRDSRI